MNMNSTSGVVTQLARSTYTTRISCTGEAQGSRVVNGCHASPLFPPSVSLAILYDTSCESLWSSCWIRARFIPVTRILCHYPSLRSWTTVRNRLCRDPACRVKPLPPPPPPLLFFLSSRSLLLIAAPGQPRRCLRCDSDNRYWPSQELQRLFWAPLEIGWIYAYRFFASKNCDRCRLCARSNLPSLDYFYSSTILDENREEFILRNMVEFVVGYISEQFTNWLISNSKNWFDIACKIVFNKNRIPVISMYHSFSPCHLVIFLQVRLYIIYSLSRAPF